MEAEMSSPGGGPRSARYFFHLHKGDEVVHDEVGVEVSGFDDVRDAFVQIIREMKHELSPSELDQWEVRVVDTAGTIVARFRLGDLRT
jgi:Domain of unknown function (DUF6894)